jgi:hypothetical protein
MYVVIIVVFHEDHVSFPCESQLGIITVGQSTSNIGVILSANVTGTGTVVLLQLALNRNYASTRVYHGDQR